MTKNKKINTKNKKHKKTFKLQKKYILIFLMIVFITLILFSAYKTITWYMEKNKMHEQVEEINKKNNINEIEDDENTEIIKQKDIDKSNPYWDYIKMNLINVDFQDLKKKNKDTVGWIQVNGTNINYPFVQTSDNSYYLNHAFDKTKNSSGWVFLDYRNNIKTLNKNTILYAHGGNQQTMFGSLKNILKNGWLNDANNYVVKLSTETENTLWQVFSVYRIPTTSDYIQVEFSSNKEFENFGKMLIDRSAHNFNTTINKDDKILTLSTCYNDNDKVVLHAKLIKRSAK